MTRVELTEARAPLADYARKARCGPPLEDIERELGLSPSRPVARRRRG